MSEGPLSPEEVAHRGFATAFRGFDTSEVRTYLARVASELRTSTARERDLHRRLAEAEHRAAHPVIEGDALTRALGEEMGRILASAQEAANELKSRAEENAARILRDAHDQAQRIRAQAEGILADRTEEAESEATEIRRAAAAEAAGVVDRAHREATGAMADVEAQARQMVQEAQTARARVLGDLTRRRRALLTQVEQLRAGRERLLEAYRVVRRTTDEVADELRRVEAEARAAAKAVAASAPTAEAEAEAGAGAATEVATEIEDVADVLVAFPDEAAADAGGGAHVDVDVDAAASPPAGEGGGDSPGHPETGGGPPTKQLAGGAPAVSPAPADSASPAGPEDEATGDAGERRSPSLRLLRRPRTDAAPGQLDVVEPTAEDEGVRVIPAVTGPAAATDPPTDEGATATGPVVDLSDEEPAPAETETGATPPETAPPAVDELFARIRAGRADAVAKAQEVLGSEPAAPPPDGAGAPQPPPDARAGPSPEPAATPPAGEEETLLQRRDRAVEGVEARLARKLKRALQDEQNEVLDRLRSAHGPAQMAEVLPTPSVQGGRYREAADELVVASARAGAAFVSAGSDARPEVGDLVDELAAALAEPLRRALERALEGDTGSDQSVYFERIGAAYRECKAQRIEGLAGDAVTAAFSRGALAALPEGAAARWVVDDDGRPCPDCDDNALAGPTAPGEAFPTGQTHPPAHAGCRCLLAPAEMAAAAIGSA